MALFVWILFSMPGNLGQDGGNGPIDFPSPNLGGTAAVEHYPRKIKWSLFSVSSDLPRPKPIFTPIAKFQKRHGIGDSPR